MRAEGSARSRESAGSSDLFSSALWKLWTLLDLRDSDRVLVIGSPFPMLTEHLDTLGKLIEKCTDVHSATALTSRYHIIIAESSSLAFERSIAALAARLEPTGRMLILCPHRMSLFRGRHSLRAMLDRSRCTLGGYRSALQHAGLQLDECWLPWPSLEDAEEYLSAAHLEEVQASAGIRMKSIARIRAAYHDGFALVASHAGTRSATLGGDIARAMGHTLGMRELPAVTRFDLRQRGALVVMLKGGGSDRSWVARVCRHAGVAAHLESNERVARALRAAAAGNAHVARYIPEPLGYARIGEAQMWFEERLRGTVAWRLPSGLRSVIDAGWMRFLEELRNVVCVTEKLRADDAERLVRRWRTGVRALPDDIDFEVSLLEGWLARRFTDTSRALGWCHGDFGYGNLLADPKTGHLQAVIDWETGRDDELIGIDWMNMLLVGERIAASGDLAAAVSAVVARLRAARPSDVAIQRLRRYLALSPASTSPEELLGLALLRIVQREARYDVLFTQAQAEFADAIRVFRARVGIGDGSAGGAE